MSRYNYRVKRKLFQRKGEGQNQDFGAFQRQYQSRKRMQKINRFLLILIALILLIGVAVFSAYGEQNVNNQSESHPEVKYNSQPIRL
ncbi:MAG: hypothetical protein RIC35_01905 [Marinoscillum sp.]